MHSARDDDQNGERLPRAGDRIAGKYVVERVLKRGGMGVVLAARHAELSQPVAIKVLLPELSSDASMVTRFLREGRAVSALRSDHVVRVHDVGRLEGGTPYLVMEMLHGSDLDRRVRKSGPLPWQEAVGYVMQVCEALVEAHALGIVHRDLKPSNLFLVELPSGVSTVKVLDFGISKADGLDAPLGDGHGITTTEAVLGSPTFMAPEQVKSAKYVDARADIWSLGLVLYFLITGKLAFDAETLGSYLLKILQDPPIPIRSLRPDVPEELAQVIHRCIEKDPALRFPTAVDLRAALAPFAPFAAHVSGMYAAARVTGMHAAAAPIFTGLSPSAPTPVGGVLAVSAPTPVGMLGPSAPTPAGPFGPSASTPVPFQGALPPPSSPSAVGSTSSPSGGFPIVHTPSGGVPVPSSSGGFPPAHPSSPQLAMGAPGASASDLPSAPPGLANPNTQASWTSAGKRVKPSGLRWALVGLGLAVAGLLAVLIWPSSPPHVAAPSSGATSLASAPSAATSAAPAPSASAAPTASATASVAASAVTAAPSISQKPPAAAGSSTAKTRTPPTAPTKHVPGLLETDL
jgi:serine/threonine-protein kinase